LIHFYSKAPQKKSRLAPYTLLTICCFALPHLARAQAYQRIAPQTVPPAPTPQVQPPAPPPPLPFSATVILPALKGVVFVSSMADVQRSGLPAPSGGNGAVDVVNVARLNDPRFISQIQNSIGKPLTFTDLYKISGKARAWFAAEGHPFVDVVVPPQNIASGVVQIVVSEYRIGQIGVTGNKWFSSQLTENQSQLHSGQTMSLSELQTDLDNLNQNPFRQVDAIFGPGATPGTTNLTLQTRDEFPVRIYAGYDNQGVPGLGRNEYNVGFSWGNAFGRDQTISYQLTRSFTGRYTGNALSWDIPLPWRDLLEVFGSYEQERPVSPIYFTSSGVSAQASLRYIHALPGLVWLHQRIAIGYDFKTTNNNLEFGGTSVNKNDAEIDQFPIIYTADISDPLGQSEFTNTLYLSPGGLTGANNNAAVSAITPGASASYVYDQIGLRRLFNLPEGFSSTTQLLAQVANHNLLSSEQLAAGGLTTVPGYDTDTALGSKGVFAREDLKTPPFSVLNLLGVHSRFDDSSQAGAFLAYAHTAQVSPIPYQVNTADLASAGVEVASQINANASVNFAMGWQLRNAPYTQKHGAFGDVSVSFGL
jgi:hemolysin activation/secretion protein